MSMFLSLVRPIKDVSDKYREIFIKTINKIVGYPALLRRFIWMLKLSLLFVLIFRKIWKKEMSRKWEGERQRNKGWLVKGRMYYKLRVKFSYKEYKLKVQFFTMYSLFLRILSLFVYSIIRCSCRLAYNKNQMICIWKLLILFKLM